MSQVFVTKTQAQAWATQTEAEILAGNYDSGTSKTLADALERYLVEVTPRKKSAHNESAIIGALLRIDLARVNLAKLTTEALAQYRDSELQRIKPASVLRYLSLIGTVLDVAVNEWQWIRVNPAKALKKPCAGRARDRVFSDDEIARFCASLNHGGANSYVQQTIVDCFLFAIETAMRAGEILMLEWSMIEGRVATLPDTKNGDKRRVPLSSRALAILDGRRGFERPFGIKKGTLASMFAKYCRQAGIEGAAFHDTRHTAITRIAKSLPPFDLARMAGHRNINQTLVYYNESAEAMADRLG